MKIMIVDNYYPEFINSFENSTRMSSSFTYKEIKGRLMEELFGTADFYSKNLNVIGHETEEFVINFELMQKQWARENKVFAGWNFFKKVPYLRMKAEKFFLYKILKAQILKMKPDVLYIQCIGFLDKEFLLKIKKHVRLIVGQIACPLPPTVQFEPYDLIISSLPNIVKKIKEDLNIPAEYLPLAFESSILDKIFPSGKIFPCTFIGGISKSHKERYSLLQKVSERTGLHIFGYGKDGIDKNTVMYRNHHGEVWGKEMYNAILQSEVTINKHIDVSENFANNMRLFEATGMGTFLLTDKKDNLDDLFEVGKEVVVYEDEDDLVKKIEYFNKHEEEREKIARAGQSRTLKDHSYAKRMIELSEILKKYYK